MAVAALVLLTTATSATEASVVVADSVPGITHKDGAPSPAVRAIVREALTWSDLAAVDSSPEAVMQFFEKKYGQKPDGVAVNDQGYANSVDPPVTVRFSKPAFKVLGAPTFDKGAVRDKTVTVGADTVTNAQDQEVELEAKISGSWTDSTEVSWSTASGLTVSSSIGFGKDAFSIGTEVSVESTIGESKTSSKTGTKETTLKVKVPPRSQVVVEMVGLMKSQDVRFTVPITASGSFGANFGSRVNGAFFWFEPVSNVLPRTSGEAKGVLRAQRVMEVRSQIRETTPL